MGENVYYNSSPIIFVPIVVQKHKYNYTLLSYIFCDLKVILLYKCMWKKNITFDAKKKTSHRLTTTQGWVNDSVNCLFHFCLRGSVTTSMMTFTVFYASTLSLDPSVRYDSSESAMETWLVLFQPAFILSRIKSLISL